MKLPSQLARSPLRRPQLPTALPNDGARATWQPQHSTPRRFTCRLRSRQSRKSRSPHGSRSSRPSNRDSGRLDRDERRFVSYMLDKLTRNQAYVPSAPQAKWILHISAKLGRDLP